MLQTKNDQYSIHQNDIGKYKYSRTRRSIAADNKSVRHGIVMLSICNILENNIYVIQYCKIRRCCVGGSFQFHVLAQHVHSTINLCGHNISLFRWRGDICLSTQQIQDKLQYLTAWQIFEPK
ncbi:Hypothetical_protein [Hexamita inflata]|uniref:Hypothetical_protein n=1 Tax=Hexamita inflata TaxID=28002 RepID=A0ABP1HJ49_9EUKA